MTSTTQSPLLHEPWISLAQAAKLFPPTRRGRPVSPSCIYRWHTSGILTPDGRRLHLEALRCVNRFVTSAEAVRRFMLAQQPTTVSAETTGPNPRTAGQRTRASERAARELEAQGL